MTKTEAGKLGAKASKAFYDHQRSERLAQYDQAPRRCQACQAVLVYEKRHQKFCDRSCAAAFNNTKEPKRGRAPRLICPCGTKIEKRYNKHCDVCIAAHLHIPHRATSADQLKSENTRRKFLLRTRPHKCNLCHRTEWEGKPIPLIMDHIDGNASHNTDSNLRLICPNCDALLPTYMGRNKGHGRPNRHAVYDGRGKRISPV